MYGKKLFNIIGINSAKDISKIAIRANDLTDVSWVPPIDEIIVSDSKRIEYFYNSLRNIKIVDTPKEKSGNEADEVKNRTILLYLKNGNCQRLYFYPLDNQILECFVSDPVEIERKVFEPISDGFNEWLIDLCEININKNYKPQLDYYYKLQSIQKHLQKFEDEEWYGGYDLKFYKNDLKIEVFLVNDTKSIRNNIFHNVEDKSTFVFKKSNLSYNDIKLIADKIKQALRNNLNKYSFVRSCGVTSKKVEIIIDQNATEAQKNRILKDFKEYTECITINYIKK